MKLYAKKINCIKLNNSENISKTYPVLIKVYIISFFIYSLIIKQAKCNIRLINKESIITIEINKNGYQPILFEDFRPLPDEVFINDNKYIINRINHTYLLGNNYNIIEIKWEKQITDCFSMFYNLKNIITIDLSKFDSSLVTNFNLMLYYCTSLISINFDNFNTSNAISMVGLFMECTSLISLDLSMFNTSSVQAIDYMFFDCFSLTSLNIINFNTTLVLSMNYMFYNCNSLTSLNIYNFEFISLISNEKMFDYCNESLLYCINEQKATKILSVLNFTNNNYINICKDNICPIESDIINIDSILCISYCYNDNIYKYEYNNKCYKDCPNNTYISLKNDFKCYKELEGYYLDNNIFKPCYISCKSCNTSGNINDNNCIECKPNYIFKMNLFNKTNCYEICSYYFYFDLNNNHYCTSKKECPKEQNKLIIEKNKCIDNCYNDDIYKYEYNNICYKECPNNTYLNNGNQNKICLDKLNSTNLINILNSIKENNNLNNKYDSINIIKNDILMNNIDSILNIIEKEKNDLIIKEDNIIIQITSSNNQKNNEYNNVSTINLGECEIRLNQIYNMTNNESLLIFKVDIFEKGLLIPNIEYEIYNSKTKEQLNLTHCKDTKIEISIPVNINEENLFKYNISSDYYNDICYIYETENGTDIILNDRRNEFINNNMSLCENNCDYEGYDTINKKALCKCEVKMKFSLISEIKNNKNQLLNNFIDLENSLNIKIMKCYFVLFSKIGLIKNIGSYIILSIILLNIILLIFFIIKGYKLFKNKINHILNNIRDKKKDKKKDKNKINIKKNKRFINKINPINIKKRKSKKKNKNIRTNEIQYNSNPPINKKKKLTQNNILKLNKNFFSETITKEELLSHNIIKNKLKKKIIDNKLETYNDTELNELNYKKALKIDKRSYLEYYFSLLKVKHLFIFSFYTYTDYNSKTIKICLFFFSFTLYYTINALFFNDSTMHKIYEDKGTFNFIFQIPHILYSTIISSIINTILKFLALSERIILKIKEEKKYKDLKISNIFKCIIIKFNCFFVLNIIFLILFWYYLSCFCAVYRNTQTYLIKDTLISFAISLFYPLIINIIPVICRISSLKVPNREYLYKFSKLMQLI